MLLFTTDKIDYNNYKRASKITALFVVLFFILSFLSFKAYSQDIDKSEFKFLKRYTLSSAHAKKLANIPIQLQNGRISTFEVYSNRLLKSITDEQKIDKYNSTQVIFGFILFPEIWERVPLISQNNDEMANLLGTGEKFLSYRSLFDGRGRYILNSNVHLAKNTPPNERTILENQILLLDRKVNTLYKLKHAVSIPLFPLPGDEESRWYSPGERSAEGATTDELREIETIFVTYLSQVTEALRSGNWEDANIALESISDYQIAFAAPLSVNPLRLKTENFYTTYDWNKFVSHGYLFVIALLLIYLILRWSITRFEIPDIKSFFVYTLYGIFSVQTLSIILQGYIYQGRFWMSSVALTALFAWLIASIGLSYKKKSFIVFIIGFLVSGIILTNNEYNAHSIENYKYLIAKESYIIRVYYTIILCSLSFLIISSVSSFILAIVYALRKWIERSEEIIKTLTAITQTQIKTGLILFFASILIRSLALIELNNNNQWTWENEYKWLGISLISYIIAYMIIRTKRHKIFIFTHTLPLLALIIMIISFFSLHR
ncbi:MAG: hypothetical protein ACRCX4_06530 [Bacteroidales bacterium]